MKGSFNAISILVFSTFFMVEAQVGDNWWKSSIIYQIYPRSFKDSNNDGVGDLGGVISKLDYLVETGVTALWLSPIYKSPMVDFGYDISDYRAIDPIFGTLDDFRVLVEEAHKRNLKVVMDFVPNHSSNQHEWFIKSENRTQDYENYYVWLDGLEGNTKPPNNWISVFGGPAWSFSTIRNQWYLHQFSWGQPDLNYRDPKLVQEMKDILVYWMDLGVDGFRMDVVTALFEEEGYPDEPLSGYPNATPNEYRYLIHIHTHDQPETYDMLYQWRSLLDNYTQTNGGDTRVIMTESWSGIDKLFGYYGNETHDGAHFTFNFFFINKLNVNSTAKDIKSMINTWLTYMPMKYTANWVMGNHDVFRAASRFTPQRVDGLNMLAAFLPGVTVTYNGEEIGMENGLVTWEQGVDPLGCNSGPDRFNSISRDFERTPFHWDNTTNAGFNDGAETWLPVSEKYLTNNLVLQSVIGARSHYHVYQNLTRLKQKDTLKTGHLEMVAFDDELLALTRTLNGNATYVLVINISANEKTVDLTYFPYLPDQLFVEITSVESFRDKGDTINSGYFTLFSYESLILVDGLVDG